MLPRLDDDLRALAVALRGTVSHGSAATAWGVELLVPAPLRSITVARNRSLRAPEGVELHRADLPAADVRSCGGVQLTAPVRTVLDLSRRLPLREAVVAGDSALRQGLVTLPELLVAVAALPRGPGTPACRAVLERLDPRAGSCFESVGRLLLEDAGLRPFETQHPIPVPGGPVYRADVAWPEQRVVAEFDGFAFHADRARYRADRRRGNALALLGWTVLRFSWEDVHRRPTVVVGQLRLALAGRPAA